MGTRRYYNDFRGRYGFHGAYWAEWNRGGFGSLDNGSYRLDWENGPHWDYRHNRHYRPNWYDWSWSHWLHWDYGHNRHGRPNWYDWVPGSVNHWTYWMDWADWIDRPHGLDW